ncbi:porin [Gallaecimonas kandeliae]|uniref:porin n=1 Tax=Gallaecimonas kandeliae TaxID=3029055 RepID=UPI00264A49DA|nr:porin [Gallaecimonas kandeliae]WKE67023.1 porin [Gallaecimonas kandeliae]
MKKTALALALAALCGQAAADVRFNGFASIVAGQTLSSDEQALGYDNDISFKPDSLFAMQAVADLGDGLTATAQAMAKGEDDYNLSLEWAYLSYTINDNWKLNAGKLRAPLFRYSSFLDVGYAYTWLRPPQSVYGVPFNTIEGLRLDNSTYFGDWESNLKLYAGSYDGDLSPNGVEGTGKIKDAMGASWELSRDWLSLRGTYAKAKVSFAPKDAATQAQLQALVTNLQALGLADLADGMETNEDKGTFWGLGFGIDKDNWLLNAEYTHFDVKNSVIPKTAAWYASLGYRFGSITPYYTYEKFDAKPDSKSTAGLPPQLAVPIMAVYAAGREQTSTHTLGLRWDFHSSAAFKLEFNDIRDDLGSALDAKVLSAGVDLVF